MPDYIDVTPLQDNAAYPGRIHLSPTQREHVIHFRNLWEQAIPAVFAQFQAVGYSSLYYYDSHSQNTVQPIFTNEQMSNIHIQDDPSSNSDQVPFIYAGLPVVTLTGDQTYYDANPPAWAYPYDLPADTLQLMNTYTSGTTRPCAAFALALALPGMLTTLMLNQPDMLGQATPDGNPIAAISDIGQTVIGQNIALDAKASFDPTNSNSKLTYTWNFGDGTTASGITVNHTYQTTGHYTLTLTVTSQTGKRSISKTLSIGTVPATYDNPYSPLRGKNSYNPAVTIPTANNNLPVQPWLSPLRTPTPQLATPTPLPKTLTPLPTTKVANTPSTPTPHITTPLILIALGITTLIISIVTLITMRILQGRRL